MAKIGQQPPRAPAWPWGGPRSVRERLVDRSQLERKNARKKGDPKNPALASAALLDFIGPAHSSDEIRLPMPPTPVGHEADVEGYLDRGVLFSVAGRLVDVSEDAVHQGLQTIRASSERVERLQVLLSREAAMLELVSVVGNDMAEIDRRRREETIDEAI